MASDTDFESLVARYYEPLYQFAFSLARAEADACDLTQQTFYIWATKGNQLRDGSKIKSWLFTTLHREFLSIRRKYSRLEYSESIDEDEDPAAVSPDLVNSLDAPVGRIAGAGQGTVPVCDHLILHGGLFLQ